MNKQFIKEIRLLKNLQKSKIPHIIVFSPEGWSAYKGALSCAVLIPKKFQGQKGFYYITQCHDGTAERDLETITLDVAKRMSEYKLKAKNENGYIYEWREMDFKYYCNLTTISQIPQSANGNYKYYNQLLDSGVLSHILIGGIRYVDPNEVTSPRIQMKIANLITLDKGYNLFDDEEI